MILKDIQWNNIIDFYMMKKIFIVFAAGLMLMTACEKEQSIQNSLTADEITVAPESWTFPPEGGSLQVVVTSSSDWTLSTAEEYDWIRVDAEDGKDGDIITFTVDANKKETQQVAEFVFSVGEAEAGFTAILQTSGPHSLELASDSALDMSSAADRIEVLLTTDLNYRSLSSSMSNNGSEWVKPYASMPDEGGVVMYFDIDENIGREDRNTIITISDESGSCTPVTVSVRQRAVPFIVPEKTDYYPELEDTELELVVDANVEYDVEVADDWLNYTGTEDGILKFTMSAASEERTSVITLTEKDPLEGIAPVVVLINVAQRPKALVSYAIDMTDARLFPEVWNNADPLNGLSEFTVEALVRLDKFEDYTDVSTIIGIQNQFLIQLGQSGVPSNQLLLTPSTYGRFNIADEKMQLKAGEWYHIAVSCDMMDVTMYINGEQVYSYSNFFFMTFDFGVELTNDIPSYKRSFWIGYSGEIGRDFEGLMTEIRIWNKLLSPEEIKGENHFYSVDPSSDGLVAYWKCDDGAGTVVTDHSSSGNDLTGQYNLRLEGEEVTGDNIINWVEVSLP